MGIQNRNPDLVVTAVFDSVAVQTSSRIESSPPSGSAPVQISARLANSKLVFDDNSAANCPSRSALIPLLGHAISKLPENLQTGMTWTDTLSLDGCSGGIPVILTSVRTFSVMAEENVGAFSGIRVNRADSTVSTGEGEQGQHRVSISSNSKGSVQLLIDRQTGSLLQSTGQYSGTVVVVTSGRRQVFNQTIRELINRM